MKLSKINYIHCIADRDTVYQIIKNSSRWPEWFEPCISVKTLEKTEGHEYIEIQAMVNDNLMTWRSHRKFINDIYGIDVTVIKPIPLLKNMLVNWRIIPINSQECVIVLSHDYEIAVNVAGIVSGVLTVSEAAAYMDTAIENNSIKELMNISKIAQKMAVKKSWSTSHSIVCHCDEAYAYAVLKNITLWPKIFEACVSAQIIAKKDNVEEILIFGKVQDRALRWVTRRVYNDQQYSIEFTLPEPMPLLKSMSGTWRVISLANKGCIIYVERHFDLLNQVRNIVPDVNNISDAYRFVRQFIEENANKEMQALKVFMESTNNSQGEGVSQ